MAAIFVPAICSLLEPCPVQRPTQSAAFSNERNAAPNPCCSPMESRGNSSRTATKSSSAVGANGRVCPASASANVAERSCLRTRPPGSEASENDVYGTHFMTENKGLNRALCYGLLSESLTEKRREPAAGPGGPHSAGKP